MLVYPATGAKYLPRLKISETFFSVQGEGCHSGLPCTFIRLTGCALRCSYCDTPYAFYGGSWHSFDGLFQIVENHSARLVQVTGGEPLHQKGVWPFLDGLVERGYQPLLETGGMESIEGLNERTHIVLDIKTPESGEMDRMLWDNLTHLKSTDEVKFVVCSLADLEWSLALIRKHDLDQRFHVLISPIYENDAKSAFAEKALASGLNIRFQLQLHKLLWGDEAGR